MAEDQHDSPDNDDLLPERQGSFRDGPADAATAKDVEIDADLALDIAEAATEEALEP